MYGIFFYWPIRNSCTGITEYPPGSWVVIGSSGEEETVDSESWLVSVVVSIEVLSLCDVGSPKSLKYPPPRCVARCSSFLFRRKSMHFISLLGIRICLLSFCGIGGSCCQMWLIQYVFRLAPAFRGHYLFF